jgi:hypothetical protein
MNQLRIGEYCRGKKIAIIGNAPFEEHLAARIDGNDIVIRMNNFETAGYEKELGEKFSLWAFANHFNLADKVPWEDKLALAEKNLAKCDGVIWNHSDHHWRTMPPKSHKVKRMCKDKLMFHEVRRGPRLRPTDHYWSTGLVVMHLILPLDYKSIFLAGFRHFDRTYRHHMQKHHGDYTFTGGWHPTEKETDVFNELIHNKPDVLHIKHLPLYNPGLVDYFKGKSIAVVGNAKYEDKLGPLIDNHDIVIRFNSFETKGYEDRVGTKFDVWAVHHTFNPDDMRPWDEKKMAWAKDRASQCDAVIQSMPQSMSDQEHEEVDEVLKDSNVILKIARPKGVEGYYPSTGLAVLERIMKTPFKKMTMVGFRHFDTTKNWHMWEDGEPLKPVHMVDQEAAFLKEIIGTRSNVKVWRHR